MVALDRLGKIIKDCSLMSITIRIERGTYLEDIYPP